VNELRYIIHEKSRMIPEEDLLYLTKVQNVDDEFQLLAFSHAERIHIGKQLFPTGVRCDTTFSLDRDFCNFILSGILNNVISMYCSLNKHAISP